MKIEVTDANGRDLRELTPCDRCGQFVKDAYKFEGKHYGSECIKKVTGFDSERLIVRHGQVDLEATQQRADQRQAEQVKWAEQAREAELTLIANAPMISILADLRSDFGNSLAGKLMDSPMSQLSEKQVQALRNIFDRHCAGNGQLVVGYDERRFWDITDEFRNADDLFNAMFIDRTLVFDRTGKKL